MTTAYNIIKTVSINALPVAMQTACRSLEYTVNGAIRNVDIVHASGEYLPDIRPETGGFPTVPVRRNGRSVRGVLSWRGRVRHGSAIINLSAMDIPTRLDQAFEIALVMVPLFRFHLIIVIDPNSISGVVDLDVGAHPQNVGLVDWLLEHDDPDTAAAIAAVI